MFLNFQNVPRRNRRRGFATGCLLRDVEAGNDDLFVVGTEERAQMMEYNTRSRLL
jgi:hypothetical protein